MMQVTSMPLSSVSIQVLLTFHSTKTSYAAVLLESHGSHRECVVDCMHAFSELGEHTNQ